MRKYQNYSYFSKFLLQILFKNISKEYLWLEKIIDINIIYIYIYI